MDGAPLQGWALPASSLPWAHRVRPPASKAPPALPGARRRAKPPAGQDPALPAHLYCAWKWLCTKLCPRGCWAAGGELLALPLPSSPGCRGKRQAG